MLTGCKDKDVQVTDITLDREILSLVSGESATLTATITPSNATEKVKWKSSNTDIASVNQDGRVTAKEVTAEKVVFITAYTELVEVECRVTVRPVVRGVEIGGVRWATTNVDAFRTFASNPEDAGMFYQWNRPQAWASTSANVEGWNTDAIEGSTWEAANDPCPTGWRVPTRTELDVLVAADREWTEVNGVKGCRIGSGSNTIFLPAAGGRRYQEGGLRNVNIGGTYWSSTQSSAGNARVLMFGTGEFEVISLPNRSGFNVRCIVAE